MKQPRLSHRLLLYLVQMRECSFEKHDVASFEIFIVIHSFLKSPFSIIDLYLDLVRAHQLVKIVALEVSRLLKLELVTLIILHV